MSNKHLSAERFQAFLEGDLTERDAFGVEKHLAACARCSAEMEGWRVLFEELREISSHRPIEGFSDRVMTQVSRPESMPLAARVREQVGTPSAEQHLSEAVLQNFLDGTLSARRAQKLERHLQDCTPCTAETDAWISVFSALKRLDSFTPAEGFAERVMAAVELRDNVALLTRIRRRVAVLASGPSQEHVIASELQDYVDDSLPAAAFARVETHLGGCATCAGEVQAWRAVAMELTALQRLTPTPTFSDQVMTGFRMHQMVQAAAPVPFRSRNAARLRRLIPDARQALAALTGVAVTPVAITGLVAYAVFSHPTLTFDSLLSFVWWQITDVASAAFGGMTGQATLLEALTSSPLVVAGSVLGYTMISALALRVLYKNLFANRPHEGRYAHVSIAS